MPLLQIGFEDTVSYANAKLPHALIPSRRSMNNGAILETDLNALPLVAAPCSMAENSSSLTT